MLALRALIFETAARANGVGTLSEKLRWGEPAYVTAETMSGSTIRIDWKSKHPDRYAMYFHCQTGLVSGFRSMFPDEFTFDGNRALVFDLSEPVPTDALCFCIEAALTHHSRKRARRRKAPDAAGGDDSQSR